MLNIGLRGKVSAPHLQREISRLHRFELLVSNWIFRNRRVRDCVHAILRHVTDMGTFTESDAAIQRVRLRNICSRFQIH